MRLSYAQNLEDYHLHLLFHDVAEGIYVDVGGGHPVADNVSFHAYLKGWRGLVVEPQTRLAAAYRGIRPRDVVESCLAGRSTGEVTFHVVEGMHGLSSAVDANAESARRLGAVTRQERCRVERLSDLIDRAGLDCIHFLKIDVEGAEADVLAGLDLARHRPQVILVEAVNPNNPDADASSFEPVIVGQGYGFAFFDNLNRFYVAEEAAHLKARFPAKPAAWDAVDHLWDWGRVAGRPAHPDRQLADVLIAGLFADLGELSANDPARLRRLVEKGLEAVKAPGVDAPSLDALLGTGERPESSERVPAGLDDLMASDRFRAALGRIACMYDGGHLLE